MRHASHVKMDGLRGCVTRALCWKELIESLVVAFADDHAKQPASYYGFCTFFVNLSFFERMSETQISTRWLVAGI